MEFPDLHLPTISSNPTDLLTTGHPKHNALEAHRYVDLDWTNYILPGARSQAFVFV